MCAELQKAGEIDGLRDGQDLTGRAPDERPTDISTRPSGTEGDEARVATTCREVLERLPSEPIDLVAVRLRYPMARENSMNSVLAQELQRYNTLVSLITASLSTLLQSLRGELVASASTEELFRSVLLGEIPARWLRVSYPSQRTLLGYIADL